MVKKDYLEEVYIVSWKCGSDDTARDEVWIFTGDLLSPSLYLPNGIICGLMWHSWFNSQSSICVNRVHVVPFPSRCTSRNCVQLRTLCCQAEPPAQIPGCLSIPCNKPERVLLWTEPCLPVNICKSPVSTLADGTGSQMFPLIVLDALQLELLITKRE